MDSDEDDDENIWADQIDELARLIDSTPDDILRSRALLGDEKTAELTESGRRLGGILLRKALKARPDLFHELGPVRAGDGIAKMVLDVEVATDADASQRDYAAESYWLPIRAGVYMAVHEALKAQAEGE